MIRVLQQLACVVAFMYTIHAVSPIPIAVFTWLMLLQVLRFDLLPLRSIAFAARLLIVYCRLCRILDCHRFRFDFARVCVMLQLSHFSFMA